MQLVERIEIMHRVCFSRVPADADLERLGHKERWLVYRRMVRARLTDVVRAALPRTSRYWGDRFNADIDAWLDTGGPALRYFRNVPKDFAQWATARWSTEDARAVDLAAFEIARWTVKHGPSDDIPFGDFAFDKAPVMNPAVAVLRLAHPVHEETRDVAALPNEPTLLCVYRDRHHQPMVKVLNPLAADLVEAWMHRDQPVANTVHQVAAQHGAEVGPAFVEKLSTLIADFIEGGILLGAAPDES